MHELFLVQSLLEIIEAQSAKHNFKRVNAIKVSFGRISAIEPQALAFAFEVQSQGTITQDAVLEIDIKPLIIQCLACGASNEAKAYEPLCPTCGAWEIEIKSGNEDLQLLELDVDD